MVMQIVDTVRRNHGLEHGTVAVLLERGARPPMGGIALPNGYLIFGKLSQEDVNDAAGEALDRMQSGERELAVSPYCGTNMLIGAFIGAVVAMFLTRKSRASGLKLAAFTSAMLWSTILSRPVGAVVQRHLTTSGDESGVRINGVRRLGAAGMGVHHVSTSRYVNAQ
ncbi:MAG: hypothetical protein FJ319_13530 [SAR202 cluster bacterium]|nr:hypothetical protein [SAR202 cluster bacterium]